MTCKTDYSKVSDPDQTIELLDLGRRYSEMSWNR